MTASKRGGARPGTGRKKKAPALLPASPPNQSPLEFLLATMRNEAVDLKQRVEAARGRFAPGLPPKLASVKQFPPR